MEDHISPQVTSQLNLKTTAVDERLQEQSNAKQLFTEKNTDAAIKPKFIPHKFWDPVKNEVRINALMRSYIEIEKKLSSLAAEKAKEPPTKVAKETGDCCPACADDYQIEIDHDMFDNDPWINKVLHDAGFNNEQAQLVYDLAAAELLPIAEEVGKRYKMENDHSRLEEHFGGAARWREVSRQIRNWAQRNLPNHAYDALSSSYEGILAMYSMIDRGEEPGLLKSEPEQSQLGEKDLRKLMKNPRYWQDRDPTTVRKVTDGFQRLYGK